MSDKLISKDFKESEFTCRCGCGESEMDPEFIFMLQKLRDLYQKPITIVSGRRCKKHNKEVGGVDGSAHLTGIGADIKALTGEEKYDLCKLAFLVGFSGVGIGKTFVHVDTKRNRRVWTY